MWDESIQLQHNEEREGDRERECTMRELVQDEMQESHETAEELRAIAQAMEDERQANYERDDKMGMI